MTTATRQQDLHFSISAEVTPKEAIEAISRVPDWWAKDFQGKSQKPGDEFTVRFGKTFVNFKVTEVVPEKRVVWHVTDCNLDWLKDKKEWKRTDVVFELAKVNGATRSISRTGGLSLASSVTTRASPVGAATSRRVSRYYCPMEPAVPTHSDRRTPISEAEPVIGGPDVKQREGRFPNADRVKVAASRGRRRKWRDHHRSRRCRSVAGARVPRAKHE